MTLESFAAIHDDSAAGSDIQIFTDSRDKVPEVDDSSDNPFYGKGALRSAAQKKKGRPQLVSNKEVQDTLEHDEGMIYVL